MRALTPSVESHNKLIDGYQDALDVIPGGLWEAFKVQKGSTNMIMESTKDSIGTQSAASEVDHDMLPALISILSTTPSNKSAAAKCAWLRSQIIGNDLTFETPFGNRLLTYADHTASGRSLAHIEMFIFQNVLPFYGNTHTDDSFVGATSTAMVHQAAKYIKQCLGGGRDDVLLFCGSGCTAALKKLQEVMGLTVPSTMRSLVLQTIQREERWVVFTGPYEHHSNLLSWRQSLAEVVEIPINSEGLLDMVALRRTLDAPQYSNRPKLGTFSACSNVTGTITDTRAIARLLHEHGAFACFDFAASGPHIQIDMRSGDLDGYDAVVVSPHKFMGGPGTPGILLMSESLYLLKNRPPSTCGGGTVCFVNGFNEKDTLYVDDIEEREDAGTPPIVQKIRCALAFWVKEFIGHCVIEQRESYFTDIAMKRLLQNPNICILGNTKVKREPIFSFLIYTQQLVEHPPPGQSSKMPVTSFGRDSSSLYSMQQSHVWRERATRRSKPLHGRFVVKLLNDLFGIQARGGCACAGPYGHTLLEVDNKQSLAFRGAIKKGYNGLKPGWSRLSFSYYMSDEEFDYILSSIEFVAMYGQRFLPLYDFNWRTGDWNFRKSLTNQLGLPQSFVFSRKLIPNSIINGDIDEGKGLTRDSLQQDKYVCYLENARAISKSLKRYPEERPIPDDIDRDLLLFRV